MKKIYTAPDAILIELTPGEVILSSTPTEKPIEMPILGRRIREQELYGEPGLDPEDALTPTEPW